MRVAGHVGSGCDVAHPCRPGLSSGLEELLFWLRMSTLERFDTGAFWMMGTP